MSVADHEHDWGPRRQGTRRCRVQGCLAVEHTHAYVEDERGELMCACGVRWIGPPPGTSSTDAESDLAKVNVRPFKPRKPRPSRGKEARA